MRKLIIKTALVSLTCAVGGVILFACACMLFFPSAVSNAAYGLGMYDLSVTFAENAYERDDSISSLQTLVERAIKADDTAVIVRYTPLFMQNEGYDRACEQAESESLGFGVGSYADYIAGSFSSALYKSGEATEALDVAVESTRSYVRFSPVEHLLQTVISANDKQFAGEMYARIENIEVSAECQPLKTTHLELLSEFMAR